MEIEKLTAGCPWSEFLPPTIQFCEKNLCSIITQPANAWSNLAYIFLGIFLFFQEKNSYVRFFPLIAFLIGITSFLYHSSFTLFFQFFDLSSMYLFSTLLIVLNLHRINKIKNSELSKYFFSILFLSMLLLYLFPKFGIFYFASSCVFALYLEFQLFRINKKTIYKNFLIAILLMLLALLIWILDFKRILCNRENHFLQGHAVWHILTALCYLYLYKFYLQFGLEKN